MSNRTVCTFPSVGLHHLGNKFENFKKKMGGLTKLKLFPLQILGYQDFDELSTCDGRCQKHFGEYFINFWNRIPTFYFCFTSFFKSF